MKIYDLHTHSVFSDGDATVEYLAERAAEKGYGLGVSDHIFCGQIDTEGQMEHYLDELDRYDVYKGVEANIGTDFSMPDRIWNRLDYCIASLHFLPARDGSMLKLSEYFGWRAGHRQDYNLPYHSEDAKYLLEKNLVLVEQTFSRFRVDILGHGTVTPFYDDLNSTQAQLDFENELLNLCKKFNVALEISGLWKEPSKRVVLSAREKGLKFSFGCDCHRLAEVCNLEYVHRIVEETGICEKELFVPEKR